MITATDIAFDSNRAWLRCTNTDTEQDENRAAFWHGSDRPCDTCNGGRIELLEGGPGSIGCPDCHGTGRHTFNIDTAWQTEVDAYTTETLRVHVIQALPVVQIDGQPEETACIDTIGNIWLPDITREGDPCHYLNGHAKTPFAAEPGDWLIELATHPKEHA